MVVLTALLALGVATVTSLVSSFVIPGTANQGPKPAKAAGGGPARGLGAVPAGQFATVWLGAHPDPGLDIHGQADILVDLGSRQILWQRQPRTPRAPASLAKLVTAMVAADLAPLDRKVKVTAQSDMDAAKRVEPASTVMGLSAGEELTVRELMYGMFLRSGNDAAEALAAGIVSRDRFIHLMNQKASDLHMKDSRFTTPVGLDDPAMRSTPYDLALAAAAIATHYPDLLAISGTPSITIPRTPTHKDFAMVNFNRMVIPGNQYTYQGAQGIKTAFTDGAGPCMVAIATRARRQLVAVIMHSDNFFADATKLFDYGFSQPATRAA
jgi:D-alanyl-D-alanine carboxypeptidase